VSELVEGPSVNGDRSTLKSKTSNNFDPKGLLGLRDQPISRRDLRDRRGERDPCRIPGSGPPVVRVLLDGTGLIAPITSILEPADARADQFVSAYHQRREEETGNDQVKRHMRGPGRVLRSRLPDLVLHEVWAYLLTHHAISSLITRAEAAADVDPDRVGFVRALNIRRRTAIFGAPHIRAPHLPGQAMRTLTL